ncbi:MAG: hypothetical protein FWC92_04830 [Defluviitaleaceae bacterium]|nr:hypothetical protein [Defluviitaleaceae bacterium]
MASRAPVILDIFLKRDNDSTTDFINRLKMLTDDYQKELALPGADRHSLKYKYAQALYLLDEERVATYQDIKVTFESSLQQDLDDAGPLQRSEHLSANTAALITYNENLHKNIERYSIAHRPVFDFIHK